MAATTIGSSGACSLRFHLFLPRLNYSFSRITFQHIVSPGVSHRSKAMEYTEIQKSKIEVLPTVKDISGSFTKLEKLHVAVQQSRLLDIQCHLNAVGFRGFKVASKLQEVVLTKDLDRVGKAGDIVKVAKGYARNKLIPQMLALPKLEKYVRLVKEQVEALRSTQPQLEDVEEVQEFKTEEQKLKEISVVLIRLDTQRVVLRRHVGEEGKLRQPVTQQDLVSEVRRQLKVQIQEINLDMEPDLLTLGEYEIPIRLPRNIEPPGGKAKLLLKVRIRRK